MISMHVVSVVLGVQEGENGAWMSWFASYKIRNRKQRTNSVFSLPMDKQCCPEQLYSEYTAKTALYLSCGSWSHFNKTTLSAALTLIPNSECLCLTKANLNWFSILFLTMRWHFTLSPSVLSCTWIPYPQCSCLTQPVGKKKTNHQPPAQFCFCQHWQVSAWLPILDLQCWLPDTHCVLTAVTSSAGVTVQRSTHFWWCPIASVVLMQWLFNSLKSTVAHTVFTDGSDDTTLPPL